MLSVVLVTRLHNHSMSVQCNALQPLLFAMIKICSFFGFSSNGFHQSIHVVLRINVFVWRSDHIQLARSDSHHCSLLRYCYHFPPLAAASPPMRAFSSSISPSCRQHHAQGAAVFQRVGCNLHCSSRVAVQLQQQRQRWSLRAVPEDGEHDL